MEKNSYNDFSSPENKIPEQNNNTPPLDSNMTPFLYENSPPHTNQNPEKECELKLQESSNELKEKNLPPPLNFKKTYLISWFEEPNKIQQYICPLCNGVFDEPTMELCGCFKIYCKKCLNEYLEKRGHQCPCSNKIIDNNPQPVPVLENLINDLKMKCKNFNLGCNWKGLFSQFKEHLLNCPKEKIKCLNEGCDKILMNEEIENHLKECEYRIINCELCNKSIKFFEKQKHEIECGNTLIECPQKCGENIKRSFLQEHMNNFCMCSLVECPFHIMGCNEKFMRKEYEKRINNSEMEHMKLIADQVLKNKADIENLYKIIDEGKDKKNFNGYQNNNNRNNNRYNNNNNNRYNKNNIINNKYNNSNNRYYTRSNINNNNNNNIVNYNNNNEIDSNLNLEENNNQTNQNKNIQSQNLLNKSNNHRPNDIIELTEEDNSNSNKSLSHSAKCDPHFLGQKRQFSDPCEYNNNVDFFDMDFIEVSNSKNKKFIVEGNIIKGENFNNHDHLYVFGSEKYNIKKYATGTYKIKIKLNDEIQWLAFGICDKQKVKENNYEFAPKKTDKNRRNNGTYILSVNSMVWNANNNSECRKIKLPPPIILGKKGNEILCCFTPNLHTMEYYIDEKLIASLTDIKLFQGEVYTPCIIFLQNCSIQVFYDYPVN